MRILTVAALCLAAGCLSQKVVQVPSLVGEIQVVWTIPDEDDPEPVATIVDAGVDFHFPRRPCCSVAEAGESPCENEGWLCSSNGDWGFGDIAHCKEHLCGLSTQCEVHGVLGKVVNCP